MTDDELLANILRRFISDPDDGSYGGYWWTGQHETDGPLMMTLDKSVDLTDDEMAAVSRYCARAA